MDVLRYFALTIGILSFIALWVYCAFFSEMSSERRAEHLRAITKRLTPYHPRHAARQSVLAAPDRVSILTREENAFFFLHEVEMHTRMELPVNARGEIEVNKRQFKKLEGYLAMAPSTNPYEAFANHGVALRVKVKP